MKTKDWLLWTATAAVATLSAALANVSAGIVAKRREESFSYPQISELVLPAAACFLFLATLRHYLMHHLLLPLAARILPRKKAGAASRFANCSYKALWFAVWTPVLWSCFRSELWFPVALGGSGTDPREMWSGWPSAAPPRLSVVAYAAELGYHALSLVLHVLAAFPRSSRRKDFAEMTLHHVCAVSLVVLSWTHNFARIGIVVMFVHCATDVFAYTTKIVFELESPVALMVSYALLCCSFFYGRLVVLPFWVLRSALFDSISGIAPEDRHGYVAFNGILAALQALHVYWFVLIVRLLIDHLRGHMYRDVPHLVGTSDDLADSNPPR